MIKSNLCVEVCPVKAISGWGEINQKLCRSHMYLTIPKGIVVEGCNLCRAICPIEISKNKNAGPVFIKDGPAQNGGL